MGAEVDGGYWGRGVEGRVRFGEAMAEAGRRSGAGGVYVEMGAHPALGVWVREAAAESGGAGAVVGAQRRGESGWGVTLEGLGEAYGAGVEVRWDGVYEESGEAREYVRVPGYAWQRQHYWVEPRKRETSPQDKRAGKGGGTAHPLLERRIQSSIHPGTHFWEVDLEMAGIPYLQDHRIQETVVVPASFYVEMALAAARELFGEGACTLEEVSFERALLIYGEPKKRLQLVISVEGASEASFLFSSLPEAGGEKPEGSWVSHVRGRLRHAQTEASLAGAFLPDEIRRRCKEVMGAEEHYRELEERGLQYGAAFRGVREIFRNCGEAIGRLQLTEGVAYAASPSVVHPALLDSGLQILATISVPSGAGERDIYLPVKLESLSVSTPLPEGDVYWGYGLLGEARDGADEIEGDLYLLREDGFPVLSARGIRARRLPASSYVERPEEISDWFYRIEWVTAARRVQDPRSRQTDPGAGWLIFADEGGLGDRLAALIRARGEMVVCVSKGAEYLDSGGGNFKLEPGQPEHFHRLFREAFGGGTDSLRGVVHLWSLDTAGASPDEMTVETLGAANVLTCASVLHAVQALAAAGTGGGPRLWLLTRGSQFVEEGDGVTGAAQATAWGLGKVVGIEHHEFRCTMLDLDAAAPADEPEALWEELTGDSDEEEVAFRGGVRFVARLKRYDPAPADGLEVAGGAGATALDARLVRSDGTYMITGGLGGLGLAVAAWLVGEGACHLLLVGRHEPSEAALAAVETMRRAGARVTLARADVTRREQLAVALEEAERTSPPVAGVIHAAGVLDDGMLLTLDRARFETVTGPKVLGAWNLHGLLCERPLDFFVMFSSAGSMLGAAGQGNHVAGNAFLDALAHYRRGRGLPALSINWSQWGEVGEAAKAERGERLKTQGVPSLTTEQGLRALSLLLRQESPRVGVMKFDLRRWSEFYPRAANSSLLREVAGGRGVATEREEGQSGVRVSLAAAASDKLRREMLEEFLRGEVGWVLRVSAKEVGGNTLFSDLGLDSLGSLELRNRLEHALDLKLPATLVWQFPTVEALAPHLAEKLGAGPGMADKGVAPAVSEQDARRLSLVAGIERLSDEEAEALLHSRLESLQETSPDPFTN